MRVFEDGVLRRMFEPRRDEVTREWRVICTAQPILLGWYVKLRKMRWVGHVACMGRRQAYTRFWWENLRERVYLGDPGLDGRIILALRWIFRKWDMWVWAGSSWFRLETGGGHL